MPKSVGGNQTLFSAVVLTAYLGLGLIAFGPSLIAIDHRVFSSIGDYTLFIWFLGWAPHAIVHGLNPFFSNAMFVPTGVNLAQNTEGPLLGWALAPITLTVGPVVAANVLLVLAMPVSAAAAFIVLRRWRIWGPAAALGGLAYGFSPYMVGHAIGHPVLLFVPLPPFIVSTLLLILRRRGSNRRLGIQLGVLLAAQYLISPEVFASLCLVIGIGLALAALRNPHRAVRVAKVVMCPIGIAFAVSVLLLAYPVWMLLAGSQHVSGPTYPLVNPYHSDLLSPVVPTSSQSVSLGMNPTSAGSLPTWYPTEAGGYIGIPVLIVTTLLAWRSRRSARMQLSVAMWAICLLLSLGPYLYVGGQSTSVPLPFWVIGHVPFLNNLLPVRISFEADACLAAIVAFGLDDLRQDPRRQRKTHRNHISWSRAIGAAVASGVVLVVLVITQLPRWPYASTQAITLPTGLVRTIPGGDPVALTYPEASGSGFTLPLLWQASTGYPFRLLGGYAFHASPSGHASATPNPLNPNGLQEFLTTIETREFVQELLSEKGDLSPINKIALSPPPVTPDLVTTARITMSKYGVRLMIIDRDYPGAVEVMDLFRRALGRPTVSEGIFTLWSIPGGGNPA